MSVHMDGAAVHIHAPQSTAKQQFWGVCLDCKQRARFVAFHTPWYGWDSTCTKCGRSWGDGEWLPLPFERGARQRSIRVALDRWARMPPVSENHWGFDQ